MLDTVIAVAGELAICAGEVALAWVGTHGAIPILGPRSAQQLADNLGALAAELSADQLARLDAVSSVGPAMEGRRSIRWAVSPQAVSFVA